MHHVAVGPADGKSDTRRDEQAVAVLKDIQTVRVVDGQMHRQTELESKTADARCHFCACHTSCSAAIWHTVLTNGTL